jgi:hypothetical protein
VEDARTEAEPFRVVCGVEDFALDLTKLAHVQWRARYQHTRMRSNIRCLGTAIAAVVMQSMMAL